MRTLALIPAFNEENRVGDTVRALRSVPGIDETVVVDAASTDGTAREATRTGARVLLAAARIGKGDAMEAALSRLDPADVYLLADGDLGPSAARIGPLLDAVLAGRADMAVAVLPAPPTGGFGLVKKVTRSLVRTLTGFDPREPLSGQRVITGRCLQACRPLASGFGLEIALTADALRMGFTVSEIEVPLEHRYTRKDLAGFAHRGRQGIDALRAFVPRALRLR